MSTVEKRRRKFTVERILPCLELSRASSHVCLTVISAGLMKLSMSATHWWFFYLEASPANTLCSVCDSHSHSRAPRGKLWFLNFSWIFGITSLRLLPFVTLSAGLLPWFVLGAVSGPIWWVPNSVFLQLLLFVLLLLLAVRHSLIQKKKKKPKTWSTAIVSQAPDRTEQQMLKAVLKRLRDEWLWRLDTTQEAN